MKYYDGILKRVRMIENKNAISYATAEGKLYGTLKWLLLIPLVYSFYNSIAYILGIYLTKLYGVTSNEAKVDEAAFIRALIIIGVCSLALIVGYVLLWKKQFIAGGAVILVPAVALYSLFHVMLLDELSLNKVFMKFYWRHGVPLILVVLLAAWMVFIGIRSQVKTRKMVEKVTENLYKLYQVSAEESDSLTEEQWDNFLKNFDPHDYRAQFKNAESETDHEG